MAFLIQKFGNYVKAAKHNSRQIQKRILISEESHSTTFYRPHPTFI